MCPEERKIICDGCSIVGYCSDDCWKLDQEMHSLMCTEWAVYSDAPAWYCRSIYFPATKQRGKTRFIWTAFQSDSNRPRKKPSVLIDVGELFNEEHDWTEISWNLNPVLNRPIDGTLNIMYCTTCQKQAGPLNGSVHDLVDPKYAQEWRGPIFAYGVKVSGENGTPEGIRISKDLDLIDFRHVVDILNSHNARAVDREIRFYGQRILGVRLNCPAERFPERGPASAKTEQVQVPYTHSIFSKHSAKSLIDHSDDLGIPLQIAQIPTSRCFKDQEISANAKLYWSFDNRAAETFIVRFSFITYDDPDPLKDLAGNNLIVRDDQRPWYLTHHIILRLFYQKVIQPDLCQARSVLGKKRRRVAEEDVAQTMTEENFSTFIQHWVWLNGTGGRNIISPYEEDDRKWNEVESSDGWLERTNDYDEFSDSE